jgi:hypothetical protein
MASACNFTAPNGEPSDLGIALEQLYGPAVTTEMMKVLRSDEALKIFDWVNDTQYNTAKEELTPEAAKSLYDAVKNGSPFDPAVPSVAPTHQVSDFIPVEPVGIKNKTIDQAALHKTLASMLPAVLDAEGNHTGALYSFEDYKDVNDLITSKLLTYLIPKLTGASGKVDVVNELIAGLNLAKTVIKGNIKLFQLVADGNKPTLPAAHPLYNSVENMSSAQAQVLTDKYTQALNSFPNIVKFTTETLKEYGVSIKPSVIGRLPALLKYDAKTVIPEGAEDTLELPEELENYAAELDEGKSIQSFSESAINLDLHSTASKNVKMFLANLTAMEFAKSTGKSDRRATLDDITKSAKKTLNPGKKVDTLNHFKLQTKLNSLMQPVLVNHKELFIKLLKVAQTLPEFRKNTVVDTLKKSTDPDLVNLGVALESAPDQITNELFKVVNNQYSVYTKLLVGSKDAKGKKSLSSRNIVANKGNEIATILEEWRENQKVSKSIIVSEGRLIVNKKGADSIFSALAAHGKQLEALSKNRVTAATALASIRTQLAGRTLSEEAENKVSAPFTQALEAHSAEHAAATDTVLRFLNYLGITGMTEEMIAGMDGSLESQLKVSAEGKATGAFSILAQALKDSASKSDIESANLLKNGNPLYREQTTLIQLAKLKSKYSNEVKFATNHKSIGGETIQNFSLPSFASETYKALANSKNNLYNDMVANSFAGKAKWLIDQIRQPGGAQLTYLEGLVSADRASNGVARTEMSVREQFLTPLLMFHQNSSKADFVDMTKSDKTVTPVISNVTKLQILKTGFPETAIAEFQNIFKSEFERIQHVSSNEVLDPKLATGGKLFFFIPAFNYENMKNDRSITPEQLQAVWNTDGSIQQDYNEEVIKPLIVKYIGAALQTEANLWLDQLKGFGGLELLPKVQVDHILKNYFQLHPNMVKADNGKTFQQGVFKLDGNKNKIVYTQEEANEMAGKLMIKQFVTQAYIMNTFSAMIVSGDPAIAFKPAGATTVNGQIKNTMKEYQKRQAKDVAPGSIPNFDPGSTFVSLVIKDPKMGSAMASLNPKYKNQDTIADAQELTTVREQLAVMFAEGKIADKTFKEMNAVIDEGLKTPTKYYAFSDPAHKDVILQAQKPVYVSRRFTDGSYAIDYIKSSSFALLPEMTIGTELDKLRSKMEGSLDKKGALVGHINRAVFGSGKKLGQPAIAATIFDSTGKINDGALETPEFTNAQQTLTRDGFKIQQEVPFKGDKEHIDMVSQADRFITAGISHLDGFTFPGRDGTISGKELKQIRLDTVKEMSARALKDFTEDVGGLEDITDADGAHLGSKLKDPGKFFDKLLAEAIAKGYSPNEIELLRSRTSAGLLKVPLWFSGSANKLESMVMSMIGTITVPKIPGKSFVQASSIGIKRYSTEIPAGAGIKYIKSFDPSKGLQFMKKNDGASSPAQVLVPFNFFSGDGSRIKLEDFLHDDGTIDPAKLPDEVLKMVGMRIPNQGHNSMLPIQIVGFLPATMGDLIVVPAEITTQMGSDFDVDKLYTYRSNYFHDAEQGTMSVYGGESTGKQLQDRYFNVFWSALTHPEMFNRVTNPLDQPDMVDEKNLAEGIQTNDLPNFFMPSAQIESYNAQKDAKRLVALTALSGTFMSDIEDMDIVLNPGDKGNFIPFKDSDGNDINLTRVSGVARSQYVAKDGSIEYRSKHDVNSALQNEVLDYAKNRTIDPLNINLKTYPAVDMLINLSSNKGVSIGWSHIARFTQQPIIKEYVAQLSSNNDTFSDYFTSDQHGKVVAQLYDKYSKLAGTDPSAETTLQGFTPAELLDMIKIDPATNKQVAKAQLSIITAFAQLHTAGVFKMRAQSVFNRGPKGPGANFIEAADLNNKAEAMSNVDPLLDSAPLTNIDDLANPTISQRGDDFIKSVGTAIKIADDVMPYKNIKPIVYELAQLKNKEVLRYDDVLKVNNSLKAYMMASKQMGISDNVNGRLAELIYDNNGQLSLAKRVAEAKNTEWGRANFFLSRLKTIVASNLSDPSTVSYSPIKTTVFEDQENTKAIIELLAGTDEQKALIQDLIDYNFLSGSTGGTTSFNRFIPISYMIGQGLDTSMRKIMNYDGWKGFSRNFVQQFLQHNPDFAPSLSRTLKGTVNQAINPEAKNKVNEVLVLPTAEIGQEGQAAFLGDHPKYFNVTTDSGFLLYRLLEYNPMSKNYTYARIDTLGHGSMQEYNAGDTYKESIVLKNKAVSKNLFFAEDHTSMASTMPYERMAKGADSSDPFYSEFVKTGENKTTSKELIGRLTLQDSPLLKVLSSATLQDVEINSNLNANERIAEFRLKSNRIQLNMNRISTREQLIKAVEHEYMHAVTAKTLADIASIEHGAAVKKYGQAVVDAYYNLEEMRQQLAAVHNGNELMEYATSSIDEFIAHAFTNDEVQAILNDTPTEGVSFWSKLTNLVKGLVDALVRMTGIDVADGSMLQQVINDAATIIGSNSKGQDFQALEDTFLGSVYFEDDVTTVMVPPEIRTAAKELESHLKKLESMQFNQSSQDDAGRSSFVLRANEIDFVKADIDSLKAMGSFNLLATMGQRQVKWAKDVLNQPSKSMDDLLAAYSTSKTWSTLINNMYDGIDPALLSDAIKNLQGDASAIEAQVLVEFKRNSGITADGFTPEAMDTNQAQAQTRDLGQVKSEVGQVIYERVSEQKKYRTEELRKFNEKAEHMVDKVQALAKARGLKYSDIMEKMIQSGDSWGMVNKYSPAMSIFTAKLESELRSKLKAANDRGNNLTPAQRLLVSKAAKKVYKTKLESKMSYVNVSVLLDHATGELKTGAEVDFEMAKLHREIGSESVDRMVKQAQHNYKQFLQEKESYENVLSATHDHYVMEIPSVYAKELAALKPAERSEFIAEKVAAAEALRDTKMTVWEGTNSPVVFYQQLAGLYVKGLAGRFTAYNRLVTAPKLTTTEFFDQKYKDLQADPELLEVYNFLQDNLSKYVNLLPVSISDKLGDSFLPVMNSTDSALTFGNAWDRVKEHTRDALLARETMLEGIQHEDRRIPLSYIGNKLPVEERLRDPMVLLSKFADMALHFNGMANVQAYAELAQQAVIQATRKTSQGRFAVFNSGPENLARMVQHYLDVEMYQKARHQEGISKTDVYSLDPFKDRKIKKDIKDNQAQMEQLEKDYREGKIEISEFAQQRSVLSQRMDELTKDKSHMTASKVADVAIKITQMKALSYNPLSAIANVSFGVISLMIHANARSDFDHATATSAMATMFQATRRAVGAGDNVTAQKILALMDRTNLMGELLDSDSPGESKLVSRGKKGYQKVLSPYQMLRQSDYYMKGSIAVAMAKFQKIQVERNGAMVEMSLWDAMDNEGKIEGSTEWYNEEDSSLETKFQAFRNRAVGVGKVIMGNQDSNSPILIKKKALGRLITQFRISWLAEGVAQRFEDEHFNRQLDRTVKGRYRTYGDLGVVGSLKMLAAQVVGSKAAFMHNGEEISDVDKENMRKNLSELVWYLTTAGVLLTLKSLVPDDDDDKKSTSSKMLWFTLNTITRTRDDISFFADPSSATETMANIMPASKVLVDFLKAVDGTRRILTDDEDSNFTGEQFRNRWFKTLPPLGLIPKIDRVMSKFK